MQILIYEFCFQILNFYCFFIKIYITIWTKRSNVNFRPIFICLRVDHSSIFTGNLFKIFTGGQFSVLVTKIWFLLICLWFFFLEIHFFLKVSRAFFLRPLFCFFHDHFFPGTFLKIFTGLFFFSWGKKHCSHLWMEPSIPHNFQYIYSHIKAYLDEAVKYNFRLVFQMPLKFKGCIVGFSHGQFFPCPGAYH